MPGRYVNLMAALSLLLLTGADRAKQPMTDKDALSRLQGFIGDWRGVGQLRRGSTRGAWTEQCGWSWSFVDEQATLRWQIAEAKYFSEGSLRWLGKSKGYELTVTPKEGKAVKYVGDLNEDGKLLLVAEEPPTGTPARISVRQVAGGDRMLVLYERRSGTRFLRMAEVGYTRKGSNFGKGTNLIECVVTGGVGTIPVSFKGKTYYVCCSGCSDYFNEDPEGVLAEYRERMAEEKKATSK